MANSERIEIRIDKATKNKLIELAAIDGRSLSNYLLKLIDTAIVENSDKLTPINKGYTDKQAKILKELNINL